MAISNAASVIRTVVFSCELETPHIDSEACSSGYERRMGILRLVVFRARPMSKCASARFSVRKAGLGRR